MPRSYGITNIAPYATAPAVGPAGDCYYNTASKIAYLSDGTTWNAWQGATGGGGGAPYAPVTGTPPNASSPTISPPEGLLWIDPTTNPSWNPYLIPGPTGPTGPTGASVTAGQVSMRVSRTAAWTMTGTPTTLPFDNVIVDTNSGWNAGTSQYRCPVAGFYQVTVNILVQTNTLNMTVGTSCQKNGTVTAQNYSPYYPAAAAGNQFLLSQTVDTVQCAVGDTINAQGWCTPAGQNVYGGVANTYMTIDLLAGTGPIGPTGATGAASPLYNIGYYQTIPAPTVASSPYTVQHNLATTWVQVQLWDAVTLNLVSAQVHILDANRIQISVSINMPNSVNVVVLATPAAAQPINPGDYATKTYVDARTPNLPAPITSGSGVQSFTDVLGQVWVAANGVNSGNWRLARDVLFSRIFAAANIALTSGALYQFDSVSSDTYGMATTGATARITIPVAGVYNVTAMVSTNTALVSATQYGLTLDVNGSGLYYGVIAPAGGTALSSWVAAYTGKFNAGDYLQVYWIGGSLAQSQGNAAHNGLQVMYMGTG